MNRETEHLPRTARHEVQEAISHLFTVDEALARLLQPGEYTDPADPQSGPRAQLGERKDGAF
jgi:hypothetical protein